MAFLYKTNLTMFSSKYNFQDGPAILPAFVMYLTEVCIRRDAPHRRQGRTVIWSPWIETGWTSLNKIVVLRVRNRKIGLRKDVHPEMNSVSWLPIMLKHKNIGTSVCSSMEDECCTILQYVRCFAFQDNRPSSICALGPTPQQALEVKDIEPVQR